MLARPFPDGGASAPDLRSVLSFISLLFSSHPTHPSHPAPPLAPLPPCPLAPLPLLSPLSSLPSPHLAWPIHPHAMLADPPPDGVTPGLGPMFVSRLRRLGGAVPALLFLSLIVATSVPALPLNHATSRSQVRAHGRGGGRAVRCAPHQRDRPPDHQPQPHLVRQSLTAGRRMDGGERVVLMSKHLGAAVHFQCR